MNENKIENLIDTLLKAEGRKIIAPKRLLTEIIRQSSVTENALDRYPVRGGKWSVLFLGSIFDFFSVGGRRMLIPVGVLAVVLFFSFPLFSGMRNNPVLQAEQKMYTAFLPKEAKNKFLNQEKDLAVAGENANTNEGIDAILAGSFEDDETSIETVPAEISNASFMDEENETINNFIKIYEAEQL
jgi:hypothetical protein